MCMYNQKTKFAFQHVRKQLQGVCREKNKLRKALVDIAIELDRSHELVNGLHTSIATILDDVGIRQKDESE
jgi:hypothetical protein